jgi:glutamine amidotransferase PdxT
MGVRWVLWTLICLLLFTPVVSGCTVLPKGGRAKGDAMDKLVCVYAGGGAVLARDVEVALDKLEIPYREVGEQDIRGGGLEDCSLLIIPGGHTARYVDALGEEGFEQIREFVAGGGGYIGICAGAYIATQSVEVPGRPPGLGIIEIENERRAGRGIRTIAIAKTEHSVMQGYEGEVDIWYKNGPMIKVGEGVETLAVYGEGSAAIVCATYSQGRVVIFSPHPEGSLEGGVDPKEAGTLKLLENAIVFASQAEAQQ